MGSSSYITNLDGEVSQHIEYVPFGEVFLEERNNTWNTPYLFNAKEFDEETGMYYYGARYYEPRLSLWMSCDPLELKFPNLSTYCYTTNNPINLIDPDGNFPLAPLVWWAGKRAVAGAVVDIGVQLLAEWIERGGSIDQAWNRLDIDEWQVVRSAGENLVKGKYTSAALSAAGDMVSYMMKNENWTWEGAFKHAGYGALSSILGDKIASTFARRFGDISIAAKDIFGGGLENRKLAEAFAIATKYKGFENANITIRNNNPIFDLLDNAGNVVDITTTEAKSLNPSSFYRKLRRLSGLGEQYNDRTLQIYTQKGQYSQKQLRQLKEKLNEYINNNNLNVNVSVDQIK